MHRTFAILGILAAILVALAAAFFAFNNYVYEEKQEDTPVVSYRGELSGTVVCVPKEGSAASRDDECVKGLRTDAGEYYVLDFMLLSQLAPEITEGDTFSAQGLITPAEMLSSDHWHAYPIAGIFSVTDSIQQ